MIQLLRRLWRDDDGALISTEWLCLSSLATLGVITGASAIRNAVTTEFTEQARSIQAINARYRALLLTTPSVSQDPPTVTTITPEMMPSF